MPKKIIVVGLSAAAIGCIAKLRSIDSESEIICFSAESYQPYNRCLLADVLVEELSKESIQLKKDSFFADNRITVHYQTFVETIDTQHKRIFAQGIWHPYDQILLATGSSPFVPAMFQKPSQSIFRFHTMADIDQIQTYIQLQKPKTVLVVGAGLNGLEAASALQTKGLQVTLLDRNNQVLPQLVEPMVATWIKNRLKQYSIELIVSSTITQHVELDQKHQVQFDDQTSRIFDMIIITTGSQVNSSWLEGSGITMQNHCVIVNHALETNCKDVYAAGDLCAVPEYKGSRLIRSTTWSEAMLQGMCAATQIAGVGRQYQGYVGLTDTYFCDVPMYVCGRTNHHDSSIIQVQHQSNDSYDAQYYQGDRLIGFVLIGDLSKLSNLKQQYLTSVTPQ